MSLVVAIGVTALVATACGPSAGAGDVEPCSQIHEGDLSVCAYNCRDTAISDADVESLRNIRVVTGTLSIFRTDLVDLEVFECLEEVANYVSVSENSKLVTLEGLGHLSSIGREDDRALRGITVDENPRLESLDGLDALRELLDLGIYDNESLTSLSLNHVEHIGELRLGECGMTTNVVSSTWGDNPSLTALDGFDSLVSLTRLSVSGQSGLTSIDRLRELAERGVELTEIEFRLNERLEVADVEALTDAAGVTGNICGNAGDDTVCMCPLPD